MGYSSLVYGLGCGAELLGVKRELLGHSLRKSKEYFWGIIGYLVYFLFLFLNEMIRILYYQKNPIAEAMGRAQLVST